VYYREECFKGASQEDSREKCIFAVYYNMLSRHESGLGGSSELRYLLENKCNAKSNRIAAIFEEAPEICRIQVVGE